MIAASSDGAFRDTSTVTVPPVGAATPFFQDNFDNGAKNSANGFTWTGGVPVSSERAYSGTSALAFYYAPNALGEDGMSEQRFNMGQYLSMVWIEYMLFVPANFVHRNDAPDNNKFFSIWRDSYSDVAGGTWRVTLEYGRMPNSNNFSQSRFMSSRWDFNSSSDYGLTGVVGQGSPFIGGAGPIKLGQWNRIRIQVGAASNRTASDGTAKMWVNDALYLSTTTGKFHNFYSTPTDAVLRNGYFLGWANSGFTQATTFFIDDVITCGISLSAQ